MIRGLPPRNHAGIIPSVKIPGYLPACLAMTVILLCVFGQNLSARPALGSPATPMRPATNQPAWHGVRLAPPVGLPAIRWRDRLNPVWWLQNADDPVPPPWYRPGEKSRAWKWRFRNPLHNFDYYVVGVADREIVRYGRDPEKNFNPRGGWELAVARRKLLLLPFISYHRRHCVFYFGWRERGNFGAELKFPRAPKPAG